MLNLNFWHGRRVLVTGHTGFKGSWLTLWLISLGAEVWGYSLPTQGKKSLLMDLDLGTTISNANWGHLYHRFGDVCDYNSLRQCVQDSQPEVVIHLAAQALVRRSYREPLLTWSTNVQGSLNLLEALKPLHHHCAVVVVTTDKVYANKEWVHGYREDDQLGGHDPYSASKAAAELAVTSWRSSYCGSGENQSNNLSIGTARAGNVIGGGDWSEDRIVPDVMRSLGAGNTICIRRPKATRPWQHVLEPLGGYLLFAEKLATMNPAFASAFNFGPSLEANRSVRHLVEAVISHWPGNWRDLSNPMDLHEAGRLQLQIDKAHHQLGWSPHWSFDITIERTVAWYKLVHEGASPLDCCLSDLYSFSEILVNDC